MAEAVGSASIRAPLRGRAAAFAVGRSAAGAEPAFGHDEQRDDDVDAASPVLRHAIGRTARAASQRHGARRADRGRSRTLATAARVERMRAAEQPALASLKHGVVSAALTGDSRLVRAAGRRRDRRRYDPRTFTGLRIDVGADGTAASEMVGDGVDRAAFLFRIEPRAGGTAGATSVDHSAGRAA